MTMINIDYKELNDIIFCLDSFIYDQEIIFNKNYKYFKDNKRIIDSHHLKQKQRKEILKKLRELTGIPSDFVITKK